MRHRVQPRNLRDTQGKIWAGEPEPHKPGLESPILLLILKGFRVHEYSIQQSHNSQSRTYLGSCRIYGVQRRTQQL